MVGHDAAHAAPLGHTDLTAGLTRLRSCLSAGHKRRYFLASGNSPRIVAAGIAKLTFWSLAFNGTMPTTQPLSSISGTPEFPGLTALVCWMNDLPSSFRSAEDTIPSLIDCSSTSRPRPGLPSAYTLAPVFGRESA